MIRLKDLLTEADKRFEIPQNKWTPIMRSELPRFKRIIFDLRKFLTEGQLEKNLKEFEEEGSAEEKAFDAELMAASKDIAAALEKELKAKSQDGKELNEAVIASAIAAIMTANSIVGFISKYSAKLMKKLNFKIRLWKYTIRITTGVIKQKNGKSI